MPETSMLIRVEQTGAEGAVAGIRNLAGATREVGTSAGQTVTALEGFRKIEAVGLRVLVRDLLNLSGVSGALRPAIQLVTTAVRILVTTMGALSGPILVAIGVVGAFVALTRVGQAMSKQYADQLSKLAKEHKDLAAGIEDAARSGVSLTAVQRELLGTLQQAAQYEREVTLAQAERDVVTQQNIETNGSFLNSLLEFPATLLGITALEQRSNEEKRKAGIAVVDLRAKIEALRRGHLSWQDALKSEADRMRQSEAQLKTHSTALDSYNSLQRRGASLTVEQRTRVDQLTTARRNELTQLARSIANQISYAQRTGQSASALQDLQAQLAAVGRGYASESEELNEQIRIQTMLAEVSEATAKRMQDAAKASAEEFTRTAETISSHFEGLADDLYTSMSTGTTTAGEAFRSFADGIIREIVRIAVRAAVLSIIRGVVSVATAPVTGGASLAMGGFFQHGGVVPGPEGTPIPVMAHGGERITPAERGGGRATGAEPRLVQNITLRGTVLTQRDLHRAQRRSILSTGELPLAGQS